MIFSLWNLGTDVDRFVGLVLVYPVMVVMTENLVYRIIEQGSVL